jgi:hypothetical protein
MTGDMTKSAQRKATANHRKRNLAKGLVRVEVQVPAGDAALLRNLAERLRASGQSAEAARSGLKSAVEKDRQEKSALDIYASDLPDEYFEGVFDHVRTVSNRKVEW